VPFAKTGGLADVLGALPAALKDQGNEVAVVIPRYGSISLDGCERVWDSYLIYLGPHAIHTSFWTRVHDGVRFYFVDCPWLFDRPGLYSAYGHDYADNHLRFATFCQAVLGILRFLFHADIVHLHDWQSALVGAYLRTRFNLDPLFRDVRIVFTIHNLEHQGRFGPHVFADLGLDPWLYQPEGIEYYGDVNFMKAGIVFSDAITTVSPRYAAEIQTPEFGFGLDGLLRAHSSRLHGILNGVDYGEWNPETDPYIHSRYSADDLAGKAACKRDLVGEAGLPADSQDTPLIGLVSRFAWQKGLDLFAEIAWQLFLEEDVNFVFLGSGDRTLEKFFASLSERFPRKVWGYFGYNHRLSHKIEAGADMFLMPSRFEPCGLNQMYSLRYGTLPIVRATGGLDDTVHGRVGFKFWGYSPADLLLAIRAGLTAWRDPADWRSRMREAMRLDFSWTESAIRYSNLYKSL